MIGPTDRPQCPLHVCDSDSRACGHAFYDAKQCAYMVALMTRHADSLAHAHHSRIAKQELALDELTERATDGTKHIDELEEQLVASRKAFADLGRIVIGDVVDAPQIGKTWDGWHDFVIVRSGEAIEKYKLLAAQLTECQSELEDSVEGADHLGSLLADAQYRMPGLVALVAKLEKENAELKQSHVGLREALDVAEALAKHAEVRIAELGRQVDALTPAPAAVTVDDAARSLGHPVDAVVRALDAGENPMCWPDAKLLELGVYLYLEWAGGLVWLWAQRKRYDDEPGSREFNRDQKHVRVAWVPIGTSIAGLREEYFGRAFTANAFDCVESPISPKTRKAPKGLDR